MTNIRFFFYTRARAHVIMYGKKDREENIVNDNCLSYAALNSLLIPLYICLTSNVKLFPRKHDICEIIILTRNNFNTNMINNSYDHERERNKLAFPWLV